MTRTAPTGQPPRSPRVRCQMTDCPHLRRQRNFEWGFGAAIVAIAVAQTYLIGAGTPRARWGVLGLLVLVAVFTAVPRLGRLDDWFAYGRHTPPPDEREATIDARAKAATVAILSRAVPVGMLAAAMVVPQQSGVLWALIAVQAVVIIGPWGYGRWLNTRM